jgi:hypothetical protein
MELGDVMETLYDYTRVAPGPATLLANWQVSYALCGSRHENVGIARLLWDTSTTDFI